MAIQINTTLTTKTGFPVPSGAYCALVIHISLRKELKINFRFFKDKASFDSLASSFVPDNANLRLEYIRNLTDNEYQNFTNLTLHQFVQNYLETFFGNGNTQLVN